MLEQTTTAPPSAVKDVTTATFTQDVISDSMRQPVLVDFWAPWCGPCKQLAPVLEKVVDSTQGKVKLVKMNIDDHPQVAGQLGIQSIPAVIAFQRGQPVDGFMGAVPEAQIRGFIERLVGPLGPTATEELLAEAEALVANGDAAGAAQVYAEILADDPENADAIGAMAKLHLDLEDLEGARRFLAMAPEDKADHPAIASARSAIELAEQAAEVGSTGELEAKVAADPNDLQARFDLALALAAKGQREAALDHLLAIFKADRSWNEGAARKQLVQMFEAWGPMDPLSVTGRRKLSSLMFS
ncbi:thioredoxin [Chelatococcus reniformis]|uniref:Thioredoxin n=1 Tax=Chelatococcus reniformis TaxID=1494448 RepID=A0A916XKP0_9HYPH|nr:thioredoxin [Chelatococcus reniformis]GGC78675.1 thioredoxin [Chelatococcus reniformis]